MKPQGHPYSSVALLLRPVLLSEASHWLICTPKAGTVRPTAAVFCCASPSLTCSQAARCPASCVPKQISGAPSLHSSLFSGSLSHTSRLPELGLPLRSFLPAHGTPVLSVSASLPAAAFGKCSQAESQTERRGHHVTLLFLKDQTLQCLLSLFMMKG